MEQKVYKFGYRHYAALSEMSEQDRELVETARRACARSYAPYSEFRVGAAALLQSGKIEIGANQESEVFPAGICAERSLLFAHQALNPEDKIEVLAIASDHDDRECYPCGQCRQVLLDTERRQGSPIRIIMAGGSSASEVSSAKDLLPFQFEL